MKLKYCIYCGETKNEDEFSQEHVIPQAIGGKFTPTNPFATRSVCITCNSRSGLYIDGAFIKSWMMNNYRADNSIKFCKLTDETILPLTYFGELDIETGASKVCELWMGPTGDLVYHFHEPYPEERNMPPVAGKPPFHFRYQIDNGFVFVVLKATNPVWHKPVLHSISEHFAESDIFLINANFHGYRNFKTLPVELEPLKEKLKTDFLNKEHKVDVSLGINFESRFLCKVALGLGFLHFGESYARSEYAGLLRKAMWTPDFKERQKIQLRGSLFMNSNKDGKKNLDQFFSWNGGHVLVLMKADNDICLYCNFYSTASAVIVVTDSSLFTDQIQDGIVYVVCPTLKKYRGPMQLPVFLAHKIGELPDQSLKELEEELTQYQSKPPFML